MTLLVSSLVVRRRFSFLVRVVPSIHTYGQRAKKDKVLSSLSLLFLSPSMARRDIVLALIFSVKWMSAFHRSICFLSSKVYARVNGTDFISSLNTFIHSLSFSLKSMNIWFLSTHIRIHIHTDTYRGHPFEECWREHDVEPNRLVQRWKRHFRVHHWNLIDFDLLRNGIDVGGANGEREESERESFDRFDRRSDWWDSFRFDNQYQTEMLGWQLAERGRRRRLHEDTDVHVNGFVHDQM